MMRSTLSLGAALSALIALTPVPSQVANAQGVDMAAERAKIANERIRRDMQRRQGEEENSSAGQAPTDGATETSALPYAATQRPAPTQAYVPVPAPAASPSSALPSGGDGGLGAPDGYSRTLAQLRVLGELRDAGYLTDDEFARIKTRIIASVF